MVWGEGAVEAEVALDLQRGVADAEAGPLEPVEDLLKDVMEVGSWT